MRIKFCELDADPAGSARPERPGYLLLPLRRCVVSLRGVSSGIVWWVPSSLGKPLSHAYLASAIFRFRLTSPYALWHTWLTLLYSHRRVLCRCAAPGRL